jgi:hypothetical protein
MTAAAEIRLKKQIEGIFFNLKKYTLRQECIFQGEEGISMY